jgi:tetrahydromethanopterin S-methyltransferase subunit D
MFFGIILIRILFAACMVFIIGYVFGNFSRSKTLTTITKIASVLAIVLFIAANIFLFRIGGWRYGNHNPKNNCYVSQKDSTVTR